jgi:hypothetical protein
MPLVLTHVCSRVDDPVRAEPQVPQGAVPRGESAELQRLTSAYPPVAVLPRCVRQRRAVWHLRQLHYATRGHRCDLRELAAAAYAGGVSSALRWSGYAADTRTQGPWRRRPCHAARTCQAGARPRRRTVQRAQRRRRRQAPQEQLGPWSCAERLLQRGSVGRQAGAVERCACVWRRDGIFWRPH